MYIRIDRGHITKKRLTHSGEYPYTRGLPRLDRTSNLKIDARLAAVLLRSRDEQKRYTGEEWAMSLLGATGRDVALRREVEGIVKMNRAV